VRPACGQPLMLLHTPPHPFIAASNKTLLLLAEALLLCPSHAKISKLLFPCPTSYISFDNITCLSITCSRCFILAQAAADVWCCLLLCCTTVLLGHSACCVMFGLRITLHLLELLGPDGVICLPTAPSPALPINTDVTHSCMDDWKSAAFALCSIAGLAGLPQVWDILKYVQLQTDWPFHRLQRI